MTPRQMQIIRNPGAIGQVGHRQFMTDGQAQHFAQAAVSSSLVRMQPASPQRL
jgi:hypothetical protein